MNIFGNEKVLRKADKARKDSARRKFIGKQFGRLKVLAYVSSVKNKESYAFVYCQCSCGNKFYTRSWALIWGLTKSCGCLKKEKATETILFQTKKIREENAKKVIGQRFGRLVIIKVDKPNRHRQSRFLVKCDCGGQKVVCFYRLKSGFTKSCGCLKNQYSK